MLYRVAKKYSRGSVINAAQFTDLSDAKLYIQAKLQEDVKLKIDVVYKLFEGSELLQEFSKDSSGGDPSSSGGQSASRSQSFQPTPFNTAPRPTGMPANWIKDVANKDDDAKK